MIILASVNCLVPVFSSLGENFSQLFSLSLFGFLFVRGERVIAYRIVTKYRVEIRKFVFLDRFAVDESSWRGRDSEKWAGSLAKDGNFDTAIRLSEMERRRDGGVSSVMRIWKRAAVTGKVAGDCCGYDSKCKRGGRGGERLPYDADTTELLLEPGNINRSHCRYPLLQLPPPHPPLPPPSLLYSTNSLRLSRQRLLFSTSSRSSYPRPLSRPLRTLFRVPHQAERRLLMRPKTSERPIGVSTVPKTLRP